MTDRFGKSIASAPPGLFPLRNAVQPATRRGHAGARRKPPGCRCRSRARIACAGDRLRLAANDGAAQARV